MCFLKDLLAPFPGKIPQQKQLKERRFLLSASSKGYSLACQGSCSSRGKGWLNTVSIVSKPLTVNADTQLASSFLWSPRQKSKKHAIHIEGDSYHLSEPQLKRSTQQCQGTKLIKIIPHRCAPGLLYFGDSR